MNLCLCRFGVIHEEAACQHGVCDVRVWAKPVLGFMEEVVLVNNRHQPAVDDELDELEKYLKQGDGSEL